MSGSSSRDFDVIIVGAGVTGSAMAALLAARRLSSPGRVALIADRFAAPVPAAADWDLRVFALSRASQRVLQRCGTWGSLAHRVFPYERMCVWDAAGAPDDGGALIFDCAQIGEPNLGFIADGQALQWQCLQAARAAGTVMFEGELFAIQHGEGEGGMVSLRLADGRELRSRLLIGADGNESKARQLLGIDTAGHAYHQDALVAHVRTALPHRNTAWQRFLPTGPLALLPLPDGRSSIVWSAARAEAARLLALDAPSFGKALTEASGGALGDCALTTAVASFPLKLQYALDYARPHAVLLGDAAHVVHPLAGQGLNLGLLDCAVLADELGGAGGSEFFGEHRILRRYERRRRSENLLAGAAFDALERMFTNADPLSAGLRRAGLGIVGKIGAARNGFARRALGITGDLPDFLKS